MNKINLKKKPSKADLKNLASFIKKHTEFSFVELNGFLAAIISGPNIIPTSEWFDYIGLNDIEWNSTEQLNKIMSTLMSLHNDISSELHESTYKPFLSFATIKSLDAETITSAICDWAMSYMKVVGYDIKAWLSGGDTVASMLFLLISINLTDEQLRFEINEDGLNKTPDEIRKLAFQLLPSIPCALYEFWLERRGKHNNKMVSQPAFAKKIGRNEPCFCGSGRKYKKCCMVKTVH